MIRLLVADDHNVFRESLCRLLSEQADLKVVAEAANCAGIIDAVCQHELDVAVIDLSMPGCFGAEAVMQVKSVRPGLRVLVLTMHDQEPFISQALRAGADGYATKELSMAELHQAIHQIHRGGKYICPQAIENLANGMAQLSKEEFPHQRLSTRESKILELLIQGMRGREIALELNVSEKTVSTHKMNAFRKMNFSNRSDLIQYAIRNHLVHV